jgi:hypothetical protein|tara:strand:+ start:951 stop:1124 length:174 start_codon:yes stop_codon:yes gene_type:complete
MSQFPEVIADLPRLGKWTLHVDHVDELDEFSITPGHLTSWFFQAIAIHIEQFTLLPN